jgi:hypothetical protein
MLTAQREDLSMRVGFFTFPAKERLIGPTAFG